MLKRLSRNKHRLKIHDRIRRKLRGTAERPRICAYRSLKHIYVQLVDDEAGKTVLSACSMEKECGPGRGKNIEAARQVGVLLAQRAKQKGIERVVFDRGGYKYHGRLRALADAAREKGLKF